MRAISSSLAVAAALLCCAQGVVRAADVPAALLKLSPAQVKAMGVETAPLTARTGGTLGGLPAQVVIPAQQVYIVSAPLAGFVEQVAVAAQQTVRRGQPLVRLQSPQLAESQRAYVQAHTQAELARRNLERDEKLLAEGIIAETRHLTTRSQNTEAQALLAERRQALQMAGVPAGSITKLAGGIAGGSALDIASPTEGVVLEQLVQLGQRVDAATPLLKVARLEPLWLEIQVPAAQAGAIVAGAVVTARSASMPEGVQGKVIAVGRTLSTGTQTVLVRALVSEGAARLQPGQFVEAGIALSSTARMFAVPAAALVRHAGKTLLFVRTTVGFRAQPVGVSAESTDESIVAGSLNAGDQIAIRGIAALKAALMGIGVE
jgi:RND family efflux transporter MFP subunit